MAYVLLNDTMGTFRGQKHVVVVWRRVLDEIIEASNGELRSYRMHNGRRGSYFVHPLNEAVKQSSRLWNLVACNTAEGLVPTCQGGLSRHQGLTRMATAFTYSASNHVQKHTTERRRRRGPLSDLAIVLLKCRSGC